MSLVHFATSPSVVTAEHIEHVLAGHGIEVFGPSHVDAVSLAGDETAFHLHVDASQVEAARDALEAEGLGRWILDR